MKKIAAALIGIPLVAAALLISVPARANDDDTAAMGDRNRMRAAFVGDR